MNHKYEIIKVMNNNVILARNIDKAQECVLVGKGIGFGKKSGTNVSIPEDKIEKSFVTFEQSIKKQYLQMIDQMDAKVVGLCEEIIAHAENKLGKLSHQIHVVLTDHIGFAIERIKMDMEINNPFLYEIKMLYPEEYSVAQDACQMIEENLGVKIPIDEVGFIAMHLHASRENKPVKETLKHTKILKESVKIIEKRLLFKINEEELTYNRLINHIRGVIDRITKDKSIENPLLDNIRKEFKISYKLAIEIGDYITANYGLEVPEHELGYMALHIERIRKINEIK